MHAHAFTLIYGVFFMSMYSDIQLKALSNLYILYETFKEQDTFCQYNTYMHPYGYTSSSTIARYAAYGKFSILVKALLKLMLNGK